MLASRAKIALSLTNLKCGVKCIKGEQARARIRIGAVVKELTLSSTERVRQSCRLRHQDSRWAGRPKVKTFTKLIVSSDPIAVK